MSKPSRTKPSRTKPRARSRILRRVPSRARPAAATRQTVAMREVRALYEAGRVPVREIAELAGITERTLYKYAERGKWRPRYPRRVLARGAGGRFVRADRVPGRVARGLAAADPARSARIARACREAAAHADTAAERVQARAAHMHELETLNRESRALAAWARRCRTLARRAARQK